MGLAGDGDGYRFTPAANPNDGGLLWVGNNHFGAVWPVVVEVSSEELGWPTLRLRHTVSWVGERGLFLIGGKDREQQNSDSTWRSLNGFSWNERCDGCFARGAVFA